MSEQKSILDLAAEHTAKVHLAQCDAEKPVFGTGNFKRKVVSESMGVHPDQIEELRGINKTLGCEVPIDERGRPIFDNSQQMRKYAKARGWRHYGY
jgi:hypothetical protein